LVYVEKGECDKAEPLYLNALAITEASIGSEHPYLAAMLGNIARLYRKTNRLELAQEFEQRAEKIMQLER
jgi:tetratricopeptide repeat protein